MWKPVILGVAALFVVSLISVLAYAATKPDSFRVARSASIEAPPETVFALINDFHSWGAWSPYEKLDPEMTRRIGDPSGGEGATYEWDGNGNVGAGRMQITESTPASAVALTLDMSRPFECHNLVRFTLEPEGESTRVTWAMEGSNHYVGKIIQVFCSMDAMVGSQFEEGLASLKKVAETSAAATQAQVGG